MLALQTLESNTAEKQTNKIIDNNRHFCKLGTKLIVFGTEFCQSFCYDFNGNM